MAVFLLQFRDCLPAFLILSVIALLVRYVYRLKYHPLAKYPGPLLAKVTNLYGAYHAIRGDLHLNMQLCHQEYGSIVRYGPNRLLVNTATSLHDIYDHSKPVKKSKAFATISRYIGGQSLLTVIDKTLHRNRRRLYNPGFSTEALSNFEPTMTDHIRIFCEQLVQQATDTEGEWTEPKNVKDFCNWVTFDVGGDFVFGQKFRTLVATENRFLINAILAANVRGGMHAQCPNLANFCLELFWPPIDLQTLRKCLQWRRSVADGIKSRDTTSNGLFFKALGANDSETAKHVLYDELLAEAQFMLVAAFETTATTLAAALFYLASCPDSYSKLIEEVRTTFVDAEDIVSGPKLNSCKFLSACIQETLRISPTVPGAMWREAEDDGVYVDGNLIPKGCDIGVCTYALHHNEDYFGDSHTFSPFRWLEHGSRAKSKAVQDAYSPFSVGPRACIGRSLALTEVTIALARVIWLMDFRMERNFTAAPASAALKGMKGPSTATEYQLYSHLTSYSQGPMLEFRKRHH